MNKLSTKSLMKVYIPILLIMSVIFFVFPRYRWINTVLLVTMATATYAIGTSVPKKIFLEDVVKSNSKLISPLNKVELKGRVNLLKRLSIRKNDLIFEFDKKDNNKKKLIKVPMQRVFYLVNLRNPVIAKFVREKLAN